METINVLMSCYNGEKYLDEQIASILNQKTTRKIELYIRDDGSKDNTKEVLKKYEGYDNIHINLAENTGVVKSFIDLLFYCDEADYYAFADQDDIWFEDKLEKAMDAITEAGESKTPILYCSNYYNWNCDTDETTPCRNINEPVSIVKTIVSGDSGFGFTQVMNHEMRKYVLRYKETNPTMKVWTHDMWCHLLAVCFGKLVYDHSYTANYRRHGNNVSTQELHGGNIWTHRLWQIKEFLFGSNGKIFQPDVTSFYEIYKGDMTKEQQETFELFLGDGKRLKKLFWKGRFRAGLVDELAIRFLMLLGKV